MPRSLLEQRCQERQIPGRGLRRRWTTEDDQRLHDLLSAGMEAPEIAFALERTTFGIYGRIKHHKKRRKKSADIEVAKTPADEGER